jgi:hypothetical protein
MERIPEIYRDHFAECLVHFGKKFNDKYPSRIRGRSEELRPIMDFCDVILQTAQRWVDKPEMLPQGESLIKLICYLDIHGYKVIEFERLGRVLRNLAEIIGFSIVSANEVSIILGYKISSLYEVFRGQHVMTKEKELRAHEIWKSNRVLLEAKKRDSIRSSRLKMFFEESVSGTETRIASPGISTPSRQMATLGIMKGLLGLLDEGLFANLSPIELFSFNSEDVKAVEGLSRHLNDLSNKIVQAKQG